jgi:predicted anti-sigma-YlaC factor YlaD
MQCDRFREAISARIDGEDPGLPDGALDAHLGACADCRAWQEHAHEVTRRARLGGPFLDRDLTSRVLAATPAASTGRGRRIAKQAALAAMSAAQLAISVPLLLGHGHDAGLHAAHELGSFNLSLAIAFAVGAIRPALSAGLAWACAIAAAGLAGTAVIDLIGGQAPGADEAQHLVAVAGALLLIWQTRTNGGRPAATVTGGFRAGAGIRPVTLTPVMPGHDTAAPADGPTGLPGAGESAAAPVPGVAARTGDRAGLPGDRGDGGTLAGASGAEAVA